MNKERFISFMQNPDTLNNVSMDELSYLINEFPYCQSAHILLTLSHLKEDNILFHSSLKTTAIYVGNRRVLKKHIDRLSTDSKKVIFHDEGISEKEKVNPEALGKETKTTQEEKTSHTSTKEEDKTNTVNKSKSATDKKSVKGTNGKKLGIETEPPMEKEPTEKNKSRSLAELKKIVEKRIREIEREKKEKAGEIPKRKEPPIKNDDLIDTFIKNQPGISRQKANFFNAREVAASSIVDQDNIVSETLANIYMDQGHYEKAKNIYRKLSLKFPEKSSYFAALIEKARKEDNIKK